MSFFFVTKLQNIKTLKYKLWELKELKLYINQKHQCYCSVLQILKINIRWIPTTHERLSMLFSPCYSFIREMLLYLFYKKKWRNLSICLKSKNQPKVLRAVYLLSTGTSDSLKLDSSLPWLRYSWFIHTLVKLRVILWLVFLFPELVLLSHLADRGKELNIWLQTIDWENC